MLETIRSKRRQQTALPFCDVVVDRQSRVAPGPRVTPNRRPAWSYGLGAAACLLVCLVFHPWGIILVWPAAGFCLLTRAYLKTGPAVFCKRSGQLHSGTRLLFAPYLIGNWIAYHLCCKRSPSRVLVAKGVYVGRLLNNSEAEEFFEQGLTAVLDLTAEHPECERFRDLNSQHKLNYKNVQILDLTLPTDLQITEAVDFVRSHAKNGKVFIHCALGCCRAPSIAAGYLLASGHADSGEEAIALVRRVRPQASVPKGLAELLDRHYGEATRLAF
jgi:protein-tyrosine phosphatase